MNIYIPKHLREIKVISDLCDMMIKYSEESHDTRVNSFSDYYYYLTNDPVKRFLGICLYEDKTEDDINYLTRLFYSVKGTIQVLGYLKKFLGYEMTYSYSIKMLYIDIEEVTLENIDEGTFRLLFLDFLSALLYFKDIDLRVRVVNMKLKSELPNYTGLGAILLNKINV